MTYYAQPTITNYGSETFHKAALDVLLARARGESPPASVPRDVLHMGWIHFGLQCASFSGHNINTMQHPELVAAELLQMGSHNRVSFGDGGAVQRPGDFPNLLSNLAGKILDDAIEMADATYDQWCNRIMDVPNFQPKTVMGTGVFDQLDQMVDGEKFQKLKMAEELKGWFAADRYGNQVDLTPIMVANDDLDGFSQMLAGLSMAAEYKLNALTLNLLVGNVTLADSVALFHASHGNLVDTGSGGSPSASNQAKNMKLKHRTQTGIGTTRRIKSYPRVVLVPPDLEEAAEQTYLSIAEIALRGGESKQATADTSINTHRGRTRIVVESELSAAAEWYTVDTNFRTIVYGFQQGFGAGGQRQTWYSNETGCRHYSIECRFGAAAIGFRGIVKNMGD